MTTLKYPGRVFTLTETAPGTNIYHLRNFYHWVLATGPMEALLPAIAATPVPRPYTPPTYVRDTLLKQVMDVDYLHGDLGLDIDDLL